MTHFYKLSLLLLLCTNLLHFTLSIDLIDGDLIDLSELINVDAEDPMGSIGYQINPDNGQITGTQGHHWSNALESEEKNYIDDRHPFESHHPDMLRDQDDVLEDVKEAADPWHQDNWRTGDHALTYQNNPTVTPPWYRPVGPGAREPKPKPGGRWNKKKRPGKVRRKKPVRRNKVKPRKSYNRRRPRPINKGFDHLKMDLPVSAPRIHETRRDSYPQFIERPRSAGSSGNPWIGDPYEAASSYTEDHDPSYGSKVAYGTKTPHYSKGGGWKNGKPAAEIMVTHHYHGEGEDEWDENGKPWKIKPLKHPKLLTQLRKKGWTYFLPKFW